MRCHLILLAPLIALLPGALADPPGATCGKPPPDPLPPCASEWDCTLSGACVAGACVCDPPWTGPTCATLAFKPAPPVAAVPFVPPDYPTHSTWGCAPFFAPNSTPCFYYDNVIGNWSNKSQPAPPSDIIQGSLGLACALGGDALGPYTLANASAVRWRAGEFDDGELVCSGLPCTLIAKAPLPDRQNTSKTPSWCGGGTARGYSHTRRAPLACRGTCTTGRATAGCSTLASVGRTGPQTAAKLLPL